MKEWTEIICVLDRSGSMADLRGDTIGGFQSFVERQRRDKGYARLTLVLFDDRVERPWEAVDIRHVPRLDDEIYVPRGTTALLDAVGSTIVETRQRLSRTHPLERPTQVIVLVMTDGEENASREYDGHKVRALIQEAQEAGWEFVFVGADVDVIAEASRWQLRAGSAVQVSKSPAGMAEAYARMDRAVRQVRTTGKKKDVTEKLSP